MNAWRIVVAGCAAFAAAAGCASTPEPGGRRPSEAPEAYALSRQNLSLGDMRRAAGDLRGAAEAYEQARLQDPTGGLSGALAKGLLAVGLVYAVEGRCDQPFGLPIFTDRTFGIEVLRGVVEHFPQTPEAEEALYRVGEAYLTSGETDEAREAFALLIRTYPDGPWAEVAEYGRGEALVREARGVDYDRGAMEEARWRLQLYQARFPNGRNRANVAARLLEVEGLLAEKDFRTGAWYEFDGKPVAAAVYYASLVRDFPASDWATRARARLAVLRGPGS